MRINGNENTASSAVTHSTSLSTKIEPRIQCLHAGTRPVTGAVDVHLLELPQARDDSTLTADISKRLVCLSDAETKFLIEDGGDVRQLSKLFGERRGKMERNRLGKGDSWRLGGRSGGVTLSEKRANAWHINELYFTPPGDLISE